MCILCDMQRMIAATNHGTVAIAESMQALAGIVTQLVGAIETAKAGGATLDSGIETAYANALAFLRNDDEAATGDGTGSPLPEGMADRVAEAISERTGIPRDRIVFCESPEQAEAIIEKMANPDKKSH